MADSTGRRQPKGEQVHFLAGSASPPQVANPSADRCGLRFAGLGEHFVHRFPVLRKTQRQLVVSVVGPRPDELLVALDTALQKLLNADAVLFHNAQMGKALEQVQLAFPVLLNGKAPQDRTAIVGGQRVPRARGVASAARLLRVGGWHPSCAPGSWQRNPRQCNGARRSTPRPPSTCRPRSRGRQSDSSPRDPSCCSPPEGNASFEMAGQPDGGSKPAEPCGGSASRNLRPAGDAGPHREGWPEVGGPFGGNPVRPDTASRPHFSRSPSRTVGYSIPSCSR